MSLACFVGGHVTFSEGFLIAPKPQIVAAPNFSTALPVQLQSVAAQQADGIF